MNWSLKLGFPTIILNLLTVKYLLRYVRAVIESEV